ncbi:uncharacterized protein EAF01_000647 [Botrytis porri]|uniref:uncharacterized protein n=1 Tax=Botrytis porri TaxID=87229 RepID=UPI001900F799|nr:uncharacterized protein EAF01_000647 [Botrytis porri]KAF7914241.1 hypothetical protein EAF01_000647 [Botrytis porri]
MVIALLAFGTIIAFNYMVKEQASILNWERRRQDQLQASNFYRLLYVDEAAWRRGTAPVSTG